MTNRIATDEMEAIIVPLEPPGRDGRRGVSVQFQVDMTEEEWGRIDAIVREQIHKTARRASPPAQ